MAGAIYKITCISKMLKLEQPKENCHGNHQAENSGRSRPHLMTCDADTAVSLVYQLLQARRRWRWRSAIGQYCVIQFETPCRSPCVYVVKREINFTFLRGAGHHLLARLCGQPSRYPGGWHCRKRLPRRNLAFNCYDEHGDTGFYPHASANVETRGRGGVCRPQRHRRHFAEQRPRRVSPTRAGASTATRTQP